MGKQSSEEETKGKRGKKDDNGEMATPGSKKQKITHVFQSSVADDVSSSAEMVRKDENGNQLVAGHRPKKQLMSSSIKLLGHKGPVHCCRFSPDGVYLATAGFDRQLFLWDVYGEKCSNVLCLSEHTHQHSIQSLSWFGHYLFTTSVDTTAAMFDIYTAQRVRRFTDHTGIVNSIDVQGSASGVVDISDSTSGACFATGSDDKTAKLWDARYKTSTMSFEHPFEVFSVAIKSDGTQLFTAGLDEIVRTWDTRKPLEPVYELDFHHDMITGISLFADSFLLSYDMKGLSCLWDVKPFISKRAQPLSDKSNEKRPERLVRTVSYLESHSPNLKSFHEKNLLKTRFSSDGALFAAGSVQEYNALVFNAASETLVSDLKGHEGAVFEVDFHPKDSNIIASASADGTVILGQF